MTGSQHHDPPAGAAPGAGSGAFYAVGVYPAAALRVESGANAGDALPLPAESVAGDFYRLAPEARPRRLVLAMSASPADPAIAGRIGAGSDLGRAGDPVSLHGQLTLMAGDGDAVEVLVLSIPGAGRLALPLSPLRPRVTYSLIAADARRRPVRLADMVAGAFARGTRIALADGRQVAVEDLAIGDAVITRDNGVQPLRWKGAVTLRAEGALAPVVIAPGTMGNPGPLEVSPHHRLFLYRREARALAGSAELLVQARHLVDGVAIRRRTGGMVEYFSLVFDRHEVVYAEGVACESLRVSPATLTRLPEALAGPLRAAFPGLEQRLHRGADLAPEIASRLRDTGSGAGSVPGA